MVSRVCSDPSLKDDYHIVSADLYINILAANLRSIHTVITVHYAPIIATPHLPQRVGRGWGLLSGICKSHWTNSQPLGTSIGIPKTMKILGQMPQPWGQDMLTNRYKSPPIAQPGVGQWGLTMIGALY